MKQFFSWRFLFLFSVGWGALNFIEIARGRTIEVQTENKFYQSLDKKQFALAFFYDEDRDSRKNKQEARDLRELKSTVKNVSARPLYQDNDMQFIQINRSKNNLCKLSDEFNVTQVPAFLLFENQELMKDQQQPVMLNGFASYQELQDFIDSNLGDSLNEYADQKEQERKERRQAQAAYFGYYGPYYYGSYCGWPYDYWSGPCWNYGGGCGRWGGCGRASVGVNFCF